MFIKLAKTPIKKT